MVIKMNKDEAFGVFKLEKSATEDAIKKTYRRLALLHHPDRHSSKEKSVQKEHEKQFKKINNAYEVLTKQSNDDSFDSSSNEWFANFFKFPTKTEYLEAFAELFREAGLDPSNLQIFNAMTEQEVNLVAHNIGELFEHGCLNQESFDLACEHLNWPNKTEYDISNPYISKFIFVSLVAKENLNIPSECNLSHYKKLVEPFKRLSGGEDTGDLGWKPPYPNLVTQERLNQLIKHLSVAVDFARTITRLAHVNLLTPENEAFTLAYLSKMGDSMFSTLTYRLISKDKAQTLEIFQQARSQLEWAINREQNIGNRQVINLKKIAENQHVFLEQYARNKTQTIDLASFKEKYKGWYNKEKLFQIVTLYVTSGLFSAKQLNSLHHLMLYFITTEFSKNLTSALIEGLVTIEELNELCRWSEEHGTHNDDYLRHLLSDDCIKLIQAGLFSVKDVYAFKSPHELRGYIEKQIKDLTVNIDAQNQPSSQKQPSEDSIRLNKAATTIQALVRGHSSRKKSSLFKDATNTASASEADMVRQFRQAAATDDLDTCRKLLRSKSFSVDSQGPDSGKTALHWASEKGHVDIVYFLLDENASLLEDNKGLTAYDVTKTPEIRRLLTYHFIDYFRHHSVKDNKPLTENEAVQYGFALTDEVKHDFWSSLQGKSLLPFHAMLKKYHLSVNSYIDGLPLMMALITVALIAPQKNIAFLDYFIEHKVDLNLKAHRRQGDAYEGTILHSILANENVKDAIYILNKAVKEGVHINPTVRDVEGKTIVLMGVLLRDTTFVSACLTQLGSTAINLADDVGRTPLHYAYLFGDHDMIELLTQHGASMECLDKNGKRPVDMLDENKSTILSAFRKFHINAATRMVSDGVTLLDKCVSDRVKVIKTCDKEAQEGEGYQKGR